MLAVRLLGQFDVRRDDAPLTIPARAAQSLFAYLLLTAGTTHRREQLAGLLWPETTDDKARRNLRHELWRLRQAIETKSPRKKPVGYLLVDEISIGFDATSDYWLDVAEVRKALPTPASADPLIETLSLYRGELLPGWYDEWVVLERERVQAVFEQKMARLLELLVEDKRWPEVLEWGERWIAMGQTPEPAYRALMVAHHANGNVSQVAAVYSRCIRALREDLGVEPSAETQVLFEQLSKGEKIPPRETRAEPIAAPAPTARPRARPLPVPLTSFIGREREIGQVKEMLSTTRLLTLFGTGGVGKTRLAIQLARELSSQYQDGAWWVDLVALGDPALVPQAVAKALGVIEVPNVSLIETLRDALCSQQGLLVLDNCEHLIAASAELADSLLGACASLKILTTSREALGISGETIWHVPSLSLPEPVHLTGAKDLDRYESTRLFVERARAARSDFTVDDQSAGAIVQICRQLDGIPLAIELAAARVKTLSVQQIAARLDDRFSLLTKGSRTALPRQQTLRATIDWSHELLSAPERRLFRRLPVFAGGWTLEAAEAVCAGDGLEQGQVLELLFRLVDKSLVIVGEREGAARYRMLETIRQYANEKLVEAGEGDAFHLRHLEFFLRLAEETEPKLYGAEQIVWFNRLDSEIDNLSAAMEWSVSDRLDDGTAQLADRAQAGLRLMGALGWFFENRYRRQTSELLSHLLLTGAAGRRTAARAKALNAAGFMQTTLGNIEQARRVLEEALAISRELGDRPNIAWALVFLGTVADAVGDYGPAQAYLEEGVTIARALGNEGKFMLGVALAFLGDVPLYLGDDERAQLLYEESAGILREIQERNYLGYPLRRLGHMALHQGHSAQAVELFKESLMLNREAGHQTGPLSCLAGLAATWEVLGEHTRAASLFGCVDALFGAVKLPPLYSDRIELDHYLSEVRAHLDPAAFETAWAEGRAMSLEQAVAFALGEPGD